jgi:lysophospholipase L1-like esterase
MKKNHARFHTLALASLFLSATAARALPPESHPVDASAPAPVKAGDPDYDYLLMRHAEIMRRAGAGPVGLLFLGDSITEGWKTVPELWAKNYQPYQPANFGVNGDTTQGVIWRIVNGELDGIHPRVVVLLLGTNNTADYTAAQIFAADRKIVGMIREKLPETKVLLLAIFPRGPRISYDGTFDNGVKRMKIIRAANSELATLDDGKKVRFLDIGAQFLGSDGKISKSIMADQVHPTAAGYQIWVDAMKPLLDEMLR